MSQGRAAELCGVAPATIRRARTAGRIEAESDGSGGWLIPLRSLVAAGLLDRVSPADAPPSSPVTPLGATPPVPPTASPLSGADADELARLRAQLEAAEHRARLAEAIAAERADALADLRQALRAIEASHTSTSAPEPTPTEPATLPPVTQPMDIAPPSRAGWRGWFQRRS